MRRWLFLATALIGCATPYQAKGLRGGYEDFEVKGQPGLHYVSFMGNLATDDAVVYRYWRQRVVEVCGGKDGKIVSSATRRRLVPLRSSRVQGFVRCDPPARTTP